MLLDRGVDVNPQEKVFQLTALHVAAFLGHENILQILLERDADVNLRNAIVGSSLEVAFSGGKDRIAGLLRDRGAK